MEEAVVLILTVVCTLEGVEGTYPLSRTHRGPHECGGLDEHCCPGWSRTGDSRLCLTPICRGCGSGICTAPNRCACPDGSVRSVCTTGDTTGAIDARPELPVQLSTCEHLGCEQRCEQVQGIPQCTCMSGFAIDIDGRSCRDVDECREGRRECYQGCINTVGSFMCTCYRGFTLTDNGRSCRRLHDYRNSPCGSSSGTRGRPCGIDVHTFLPARDPLCGQTGRPCETLPSHVIPSVVQPPLLRPCGSDGIPCGSPPSVNFGSQSPCRSGSSPCDSYTPEIPISVEYLPPPPCGSDTQPCGSELPCGSDSQPCAAVPQVPGCRGSDCNPSFPRETSDDRQEWFPEFTNTEFRPLPCVGRDCDTATRVVADSQPCTSDACQFVPEMSPDNIQPFDPKVHNPSPCLSSTCLHSPQTRTRNTQFIEQTGQFIETKHSFFQEVPPFAEVPRGIYPCPRAGCQTGYSSHDAPPTFHDVSHRVQTRPPENAFTTSTLPSKTEDITTEQTPAVLIRRNSPARRTSSVSGPALSRPSYRLEPITEDFDQDRRQTVRRKTQQLIQSHDGRHTQRPRTGVPHDVQRLKGHNILDIREHNTDALPKKIHPRQGETTTVMVAKLLPVELSDQSLHRSPYRRRKLKENRTKRRRRKNKRKKKKSARTIKPKELPNRAYRKSAYNDSNIYTTIQGTTTPLPVDYNSGTSTTIAAIASPEIRKSSFKDKIKSFLTEFNKLRGQNRNNKQATRLQGEGLREEERRAGERQGQERICRDDLCTSYLRSFGTDDEAVTAELCPPGYRHRVEGATVYCQALGEEVVSDLSPGVTSQPDFPGITESSTSPDVSHHPVPPTLKTNLTGVTNDHVPTPTSRTEPVRQRVICPTDKVVVDVPGGVICQVMGTTPVPTPTCTSGESGVLTSSGWRCVGILTLSPCPDGLEPVDTPVGRLCQYTGREQSLIPRCPPGQEQIRTRSGYVCKYKDIRTTQVSPRKCSPGFILLDTTDGPKCIKDPSLRLDVVSCPVGFRMSRGHCQPVGTSDGRSGEPCPLGQEAVLTDSGQVCQYRSRVSHANHNNAHISTRSSLGSNDNPDFSQNNPANLDRKPDNNVNDDYGRYHDDLVTRCPRGQIVTQKRSGFFCDITAVDVTEWICSPREIIVQLTFELACVEDTQTAIVCGNDLELGWSDKDHEFTCLHPSTLSPDGISLTTQPPVVPGVTQVHPGREEPLSCGIGEIQVIDDAGRRCVDMETNGLCGDTFVVQTLENGQKICKSRTMKLKCPDGYELVASDCIPIGDSIVPLSPCEDNYSISDDDGVARCVLFSVGSGCSGEDETPGCGRSLESLQMACNPQCSNGGVCEEGICICPPGVTGVACHLDVDECQLLPRGHCQYNCLNTFGSYRCVCPPDRIINGDGRTCKAVECSSKCLNGGHCRAGTCQCAAGFEGTFCQTDIDECERHSRLCQHHCRNTHGGYACVCSPGSRLRQDGRTCVNTTCVPECRNGGVCIRHRCQCPHGYQGITCQLDINECLELPCSHICTNLPGRYVCACPAGFALSVDQHTCSNSTITGL